MSLKGFHIVFIVLSTLLCVYMAVWGWDEYKTAGTRIGMAVGVSGVVGLILLVPYYNWFRKKAQGLKAALLIVAGSLLASTLSSHPLLACSACFNADTTSPAARGLKFGILFLMVIIGSVLGGIASIGVMWARRARVIEQASN